MSAQPYRADADAYQQSCDASDRYAATVASAARDVLNQCSDLLALRALSAATLKGDDRAYILEGYDERIGIEVFNSRGPADYDDVLCAAVAMMPLDRAKRHLGILGSVQ